MRKNYKILNISYRNSKIRKDLSEEGYEDITNINFGKKIISIMELAYKENFSKMKFQVMDTLDMNE